MTIQLVFSSRINHGITWELWSRLSFSVCVCQESLKSEIAHVLVRILRKKRLPPCTSDLWTEFVASCFFLPPILFLLPQPTAYVRGVLRMGASHDVYIYPNHSKRHRTSPPKMLFVCSREIQVDELYEFTQVTYIYIYIWPIYNDLSRGHPKWWFSKGIPPKMASNQVKDL